ncbi:MAG: hypothetical protein IKH59_01680 [Bacteroidaceae bacterium]|nr:hypothetical protein [Bacteroidaceae bacterium]
MSQPKKAPMTVRQIAALTLCLVFLGVSVGCKSRRAVAGSSTAAHTADSTSVTIAAHGQLSTLTVNTDSIVSVILQHVTQQQTSQEEQQEHITETVTSYIDSLGREVRQEQRTIDRDISRQMEFRHQQWQQEEEQRIASAYARIDSLYAALYAEMQSYIADSSAVVATTPKTGSSDLHWLLWLLLAACISASLSLLIYTCLSPPRRAIHDV